MPTLDVVSTANKKAGKVELDASVFEAPVREHLFHAEVRRQQARHHRGTHSSKNRSAVSGGGSKPWKQKGTGRARQGSSRSPQWAGGGVVFGPVPRSYDHKLPKKMRRAALCSALSQKAGAEAVTVVDAFDLPEFKTKRVIETLEGLGLGGEKVLIVTEGRNDQLEKSAKNLSWVKVLRAEGLNVLDVLWSTRLVLTQGAVTAVNARLGGAAAEETS